MSKHLLSVVLCLFLAGGTALAQEVVVTDFPLGIGGSVDASFFEPYYPALQSLADTLAKYPLALAIVTGAADGNQYREQHDAKNPGLALGRAHALRNVLITRFAADSNRVVVQSTDVATSGPQFRYARVRLAMDLSDLERRLKALEDRPPLEKHFTEVHEVPAPVSSGNFGDFLGFQFSGGATTSPFGGMPMVAGALSWKRTVYVEAMLGHTFWDNTFTYSGVDLDTKRRLAGAQLIYFPWEDIPVGAVGGWVRVEEVSEHYYKYVQLSEGPVLGVRGTYKFLSLTALYNPSRHRLAGHPESDADHEQFLLSLTAFFELGGTR